jgi:hypothetical protein
MRLLLAIALLWPLAALAQITYTTTPGSGYLPLNGAKVSGSISVHTDNAAPPVQHTLDGVNIGPPENLVPIDLFGDLALWDTTTIADGTHVLKAGAHTATFTVSNKAPAPPSPELVAWQVRWMPVTTYEDGKPLTGALTYRLEAAPSPAGPWASVWSGSVTAASVQYAAGTACWRVFANFGAESDPSSSVCASKAPSAPPSAPIVVGGGPRALALVSGSSTGSRAVYLKSAKGSRGTKVGDLKVGPVNGDFERIECDPADSYVYGGNRYARVKAPLDGYVPGCYSVGMH